MTSYHEHDEHPHEAPSAEEAAAAQRGEAMLRAFGAEQQLSADAAAALDARLQDAWQQLHPTAAVDADAIETAPLDITSPAAGDPRRRQGSRVGRWFVPAIAFASLAVLAIALAAGAAQAQSAKGQFSFEAPGEAVKPAGMTQGQAPKGALGQTHHGYYYSSCYNYYRWYFDRWYGWRRYYVGTRCY